MQTVSVRLRAITSGWNSAMRSAASSMGGVQRNAEKLTRIGGTLSATVTPAILGIGAAAVGVGMKFESAMSGVAAVTGASEDALASMSAQAQELGRTTQFSASEAAGALEFLGMAGFSAQEATEALPDTLSLAAAGGLELAGAADLASNVLQQFALEVEETGRVADVLAQTATNSNTSVEQLGQAMQMAGPVANAAGLELEETAAAIGAMGNAGIQASQAGTSLRGAMTRLLNASGPAAEVIAELGINAEKADGTLRPLPVIIDQLSDSGATAGQMMEIFGQRAGPAMAALVQQGGDALRDLTGTIEDSAGAAEQMAEIRMDNLSGDLKELRSAAEGAGIAVFESGLDESLRGIASGATAALQGVAGLPDPMLKTGVALGGIAAAAGPAITAVGMIANKAPDIADSFRTGRAQMGRFAKFLAGPWGAAMVGAAAVAGTLISRMESISAAADSLRQDLDGVAASADTLNDEWLVQELRQKDVLAVASDLGLSMDTLRRAAAGNAAAQDEVSASVGQMERQYGGLAQLLPGVRSEETDLLRVIDELAHGTEKYNRELEAENEYLDHLPSATEQASQGLMGMRGTTEQAGGSVADLATGFDGFEGEVEDATSAIERFADTMESRILDKLDLEAALSDWEAALDDMNDTIDENIDKNGEQGRSLDLTTEIGRENREVLRRMARSTAELATQQAEQDGNMQRANATLREGRDRLIEQLVAMGRTRGEARRLVDQYGLIPDEIRTQMFLDSGAAEASLAGFRRALELLTGQRYTVTVDQQWGRTVSHVGMGGGRTENAHTGGWMGARRMHAGSRVIGGDGASMPGLASDEVPIIAQTGEFMVNRQAARRHGALLEAINVGRFHQGGGIGARSVSNDNSRIVNLTVQGEASPRQMFRARDLAGAV